jgi:tetratricopeptide (TPR) repeat protein
MDKIACISFPRSGHHLLTNILMKYFSQDVSYKEIEDSTECSAVYQAGALFYCEYYDHCQTHPCSDFRTNFQKNHDFHLDLECQFEKQLIQIRHPIESIISYYKYCYGINEYSKNDWQHFAQEKASYWKKFVHKWVIQNDCKNSKVLIYNDILNSPAETISNIVSFMEPKDCINYDLIQKIVRSLNIKRKTNINEFVFYDESFLSDIEYSLEFEMQYLKMDLLFLNSSRNFRVECRHNKAIIATSLAPGNEDIQRKAIESWRANGFEVVSLNSKNEIEKIKQSYAGIKIIEAARTADYIFGKPYIFLNDIMDFLGASDANLCGIINSDIIMAIDPDLKASLLSEVRNRSLVYASRLEIQCPGDLNGSVYNAGYDLFFFSPDLCNRMPQSLASMGVTWWDYWFPLFAALKGFRLKKICSTIGYHVSHPTNWSNEQWTFMGFHIAQALYYRRGESGLNFFEDDVFKKLETMIRGSAYYSLAMEPEMNDKIYSSYFNLHALSRAILAFLNSESASVSFGKQNRDRVSLNSRVDKLNDQADKKIFHNRLESAHSILCDAFSIDPDNSRTLCNLGTTFLKNNNHNKALNYFRLCLAKSPFHPVATYHCGRLLMQSGQSKLAEKLFSMYLHQNPWDLKIGSMLLEMQSNLPNAPFKVAKSK